MVDATHSASPKQFLYLHACRLQLVNPDGREHCCRLYYRADGNAWEMTTVVIWREGNSGQGIGSGSARSTFSKGQHTIMRIRHNFLICQSTFVMPKTATYFRSVQ